MPASDSAPATRTTRPGRRARSERAILDATRALIGEVGVRGLTIEGVAARSGVAKTTIYRRWGDRDELALAAVWTDLVNGLPEPTDIGGTREELLAFVEPLITILRSPLMGGVIRGLASEIAANSELSQRYRAQFIEPRLEQLAVVIARGIQRGDLRSDTDVRLVHEMLVGPAFYRLLFSGRALDKALASRVTDAVLRAFAAGGPA
jgi:AcrR family transcriptional regulator